MWRRFALVLLLLLASCGGGSGTDGGVASLENTTTTTEAPAVNAELQLLAFAQCIREEGVEIPDPSMDPSGNMEFRPSEAFDPGDLEDLIAAAETCRHHLDGVSLGFEDIDLAAVGDVLLEFSLCMRSNGFDMPDPDFSFLDPGAGSIPSGGPFGDLDFDDPAFLDALEGCEDVLESLGEIGR
jgi:hypothetical protein